MSKTRYITSISRFCSAYQASRFLSSTTRSNLNKHQSLVGTPSLGYRYLNNYSTLMYKYGTRNFSTNSSVQSGAPSPSQSPSNSWSWILGLVLTVVLPFATNKWGPLLKFKDDVDNTVEIIDEIVEVVEKVAEVVDKVAVDVGTELPEGGKLKKLVDIVEDVAEKTAKDAHAVGDAIDKFHEVEGKVETIVQTLGYEVNAHPQEQIVGK